jgi:hypothetical protein
MDTEVQFSQVSLDIVNVSKVRDSSVLQATSEILISR